MSEKIMSDKQDVVDTLEELDVIEARELRVGHEFHAFRFNSPRIAHDQLDDHTLQVVKETLRTLAANNIHIDAEKLLDLAQTHAVEANPISNFARGLAAAASLGSKKP